MKLNNIVKKILPVVLSAAMIFTSVPVYANEQVSDNASVAEEANLQTISDDTGMDSVSDDTVISDTITDTEDDVVSANTDTDGTIDAVSSAISEDYANEASENSILSDNTVSGNKKPIRHLKTGYLPSDIALTDNGQTNDIESVGSTLPDKYINTAAVTSIKDQAQTSLCWIFSTVKACEADLIKNHNQPQSLDLSEKHMAYWYLNKATGSVGNGIDNDYYENTNNWNNFSPSQKELYTNIMDKNTGYMEVGGNDFRATSVLSSWKGLVQDKGTDSFTNNINNVTTMLNNETSVPSNAFNSPYHLQNAIITSVDGNTDKIKQMIYDYGAVTAGCHLLGNIDESLVDKYGFDLGEVGSDENDVSFYSPHTNICEHQITIVGWDDNYSASNFHGKDGVPAGNGAWYCANSWGTNTVHMDNGFFYISYYDGAIRNDRADAYDIATSSDSDWYDNNYQVGGLGMTTSALGTGSPSYGVLFDASVSNYESLKAVSMWTFGTNQSYTIKIYKNPTTTNDILNIDKIAPSLTQNVTLADSGYHTIELSSPVSLSKGDKFYVQINNPEKYPVAWSASGNSLGDLSDFDTEDGSNKNTGYYLGRPIGNENISGKSYSYFQDNETVDTGCDYCIHAFTDNTTAPSVTDTPSTISFKSSASSSLTAVNNTADLSALVDFTAGSVSSTATTISSYTSSDTSVVAISGTTATALKAGTATVTVTTSDGKTATVIFTITSSSPDPTPDPETKTDINSCSIAGISASYPYTGKAYSVTPAVVYNASILSSGTDYTLTHSTDTTNVGTVTYTITGKGNYIGSVTKTFSIVPQNITNCTISDIPAQTYTGSALQPAVTVTNGSTAMTAGTDYTVSYSNNTEIGTATVTITGAGTNYTGSAAKTFTISKAGGSGDDPVTPKNAGTATIAAKQKLDISSYFSDSEIKKYAITDSSQRRIASVNSKGIVTGKNAGTAVITAYTKDGKTFTEAGTYTVTVEKPVLARMYASYAGQTVNTADNITGLTNVKVTQWISSKPAVAAVDANTGVITVLSKGSTNITAVFGEGISAARYTASLKAAIPAISRTALSIRTGAKSTLKVTNTKIIPSWTVSDNTVASIDVQNNGSCKVTALKAGTTDISGCVDGQYYTCTLTVVPPVIKKAAVTMMTGSSYTVGLKNTNIPYRTVEWTSSDPDRLSVGSYGKVTALKAGTATVSTNAGGVINSCEITITAPVIAKTDITVKANKTAKVSLKGTKLKVTDWTSENPEIASVDAGTGKVTGIKAGTTKVYTMTGGVRNECNITVVE